MLTFLLSRPTIYRPQMIRSLGFILSFPPPNDGGRIRQRTSIRKTRFFSITHGPPSRVREGGRGKRERSLTYRGLSRCKLLVLRSEIGDALFVLVVHNHGPATGMLLVDGQVTPGIDTLRFVVAEEDLTNRNS